MPGRGCKSRADVGDKTLLLFVEANPKYPWTVYGGGDFSVNVYLPRETLSNPAKYTEDIFDSVAFFSYWSHENTRLRHESNRRVYDKLLNLNTDRLYKEMAVAYDCTPADAKKSQLYETALELLETEVAEPSEAVINPALYYYDADDISMWANVVSKALPQALQDIRNNPQYAFGADSHS